MKHCSASYLPIKL